MSKFIIGLTGSLGSGCTTIAKHLEKEHGYNRISISQDILKPLAQKDDQFDSIEEKQNFGNKVRENNELRKDYKTKLLGLIENKNEPIVIECFRNPIEIDMLRNEYSHFYLLAVYAPKEERQRRKNSEKGFELADKRDKGEKMCKPS